MADQKAENLLNLALNATPEERERSRNLNVGYDPQEKSWDLIVKYSGSLDGVRELGGTVAELLNGFAVITIAESRIEQLSRLPQIEYIEKPKRLYFQVDYGKAVSCITAVQEAAFDMSSDGEEEADRGGLRGKGVLVAVLDSGIDYTSADFRKEDGTTRIRSLWDQTLPGRPPAGYSMGTEFTEEQIDEALRQRAPEDTYRQVQSQDFSGHGTPVAAIAAGNGRGSTGARYAGVAPEAELLIVKLGAAKPDQFPRTTELIQGLNYVLKKALEYQMPVAVNISFGNTYGAHNGTSLLEYFIDAASNFWENVICVGSGNEGTAAGYAKISFGEETEVPENSPGRFAAAEKERVVELAVQEPEPALNLQIWKAYTDEIRFWIESPSGAMVGPFEEKPGAQRFILEDTEVLLYYGEPSPYSVSQEIFLEFLPKADYIDAGVWKIHAVPVKVVDGSVQMWLPSQQVLNQGTAFLRPSQEMTITIPATASKVVTVGAYDARTLAYSDFSGRGEKKPDLVAPGVGVMTLAAGGEYRAFTGTSFAVPFVTGSAALLMEWGIVRGNDPYMYGEKVKAYLRKGAKQLPGYQKYPNGQVGYGALCVSQSLPQK